MNLLKVLFGDPQKTDNPLGSNETAHINQEMYKKSVELTERNKTLALLQRIDELILSSITHPEEIARLVTSLLVTHIDFQIASIFLFDKKKNLLKRIALSEEEQAVSGKSYFTEISLSQNENIIIQAINEKKLKITPSLGNVLLPQDGSEQLANIKSVYTYPLSVRSELIGAMIIGLKEDEPSVSEFRRDLLNRLAETIGIAIDNSLLYSEVQAANERLKELDKLKTEFVSLASHELRTPMTAIKSYLWMALEGKGGPLTEQQKYYVDRAYVSADRLIKLVNDMLNISRIESGRLSINVKSVNLTQLVQEVIEEISPHANEVGVSLKLDSTISVPNVLADADKIKEVLFNLIGNSLKFTQKDGKVVITFAIKDTMIETTVSDTGSGIDKENLPKLFQKFGIISESYANEETKATSGTGLGLYVSKAIIELHEGKIWATSEGKGKGTQFHFSLKIFNEADFKKFTDIYAHNIKEGVDLVHTQG